MSESNEIRKQQLIQAPAPRVWRAITDVDEFGAWFGAKLESPFLAGRETSGRITHPEWQHLRLTLRTEAIEPETRFAYRWHPYAIDMNRDYSSEPMTLVEFLLQPRDGGTLLSIVESGFDRLPPDRADEARRMNERGWTQQLDNLAAHVA